MNPVALEKDGSRRPIAPSEIVATARRGEVVVIPEAMQRIGLHGELVETVLGAIRDACGVAAAEEVGRRGIEKLHEILDGPQIERAANEIDRRLLLSYPRTMKAIGRQLIGLDRPFYIPMVPIMRLALPDEFRASRLRRLTQEKSPVLLNAYPPHRDSWFISPINTLNAWIAISAVERENGLYFYPDMWGEHVEVDDRRQRDFGTLLTFALDAGDLALFDNRQLHASAANVSASTRLALSGRVCPERPIAPSAAALDTVSLWSPLVDTRLEPLAALATKMSGVYIVERLKRRASSAVTALERRIGGAPLRAAREALRYRRGDRLFDA